MKKVLLFEIIILVFYVFLNSAFGADPHIILSASMIIDGKPDEDLDQKATAFNITLGRIGAGIGPYTAYLCYDAQNLYLACKAKDDFVSCLDEVSNDFKDSDYLRLYICVDETFKGRQTMSSKNDWALIFTPQDVKGNWKPMVKECPYNGPGHGAISGDDVTPKRASGPLNDGWYLEAAIPFSLFGITYSELAKRTFGIYLVAGDTDKSGTRTGEVTLPGDGIGNYWNSPDFWQQSRLGKFMSVEKIGKKSIAWGIIKEKKHAKP